MLWKKISRKDYISLPGKIMNYYDLFLELVLREKIISYENYDI
jgi:hypothetical protein